ncbi:MAG TPA: HlyD family efflux transporter periplasmic adaptor subunit [Pirellulales bacterium]|nr:HlyD family efflux transporter periplasmic adaptor subunit [Pirellulales bacterium]
MTVSPAPVPRGRLRKALAALLAIAAAAAAVVWGSDPFKHAAVPPWEVARVSRGEVVKTFTADGDLESADNVEITCKVPGGSAILWIIPDGTQVRAGDEVARLDASALEDRAGEQMIAVEEARAAEITAKRDLAAAAISVVEYAEGTFVRQWQECDANVAIARQNLFAAERTLKSTARLARRGFVTPVQREANEFSLVRAAHALAIASRAKSVLEKYNRPKLLAELESRREIAQAEFRSAVAKAELERTRLRRYQARIAQCVILAPQAGLVIHANDPNRGRSGMDGPQIEEGAQVRERQVIMRLPDMRRMQARLSFHESLVDHVRPGVPAKLTVKGREFSGVVEKVTHQPERSRRWESHIKKFAAIVRIDGQAPRLRPGETAQVELLLEQRHDVLTAPLAAVTQQGRDFYAWVGSSLGPERRRVELGAITDDLAEIRSGLAEGDVVVLHPRDVLEEARRDVARPQPVDVAKRFGLPPAATETVEPPATIQPLHRHSSAGGE